MQIELIQNFMVNKEIIRLVCYKISRITATVSWYYSWYIPNKSEKIANWSVNMVLNETKKIFNYNIWIPSILISVILFESTDNSTGFRLIIQII